MYWMLKNYLRFLLDSWTMNIFINNLFMNMNNKHWMLYSWTMNMIMNASNKNTTTTNNIFFKYYIWLFYKHICLNKINNGNQT